MTVSLRHSAARILPLAWPVIVGQLAVLGFGTVDTVLAGRHRPLRVWVSCLYLMGLNLSNRQIAQELDLGVSDAQAMTETLRQGLTARLPPARLEGEVEIDEVYVVAGHKGQPAAVAKGGGRGAGVA